ncbi:MAG: SH3 domain-containing protein [Candidatus Omnitrophica bacterium]|nr:SH3 domain-containing protein [Candidatus Omnitrophota bacterium]
MPGAAVADISEETPPPFVGLITGDRVNIRSAPSLSAEVISQLSKGNRVQVLQKRGDWYGVRLPPAISVYVLKGNLQMEGDGSSALARSRVRIRTGPGMAYAGVGSLSEGQRVRVKRFVRDWAEIEAAGKGIGWVNRLYVTYFAKEEGVLGGDNRSIP